jgi:gliding motility-associated-like protein
VVTGGLTGGAIGTAQTFISGTLVNATSVVQTATYTVTPTSGAAGTCTGAPFTVTVSINPAPIISDYANNVICSGSGFSVTPVDGVPAGTIVPAGTTYTWGLPVVTGGITGGATGTSETSIFGTLNNPTTVTQTAVYTVSSTSGAAGACPGPSTFTVTVTVNPTPVIFDYTSTICSGNGFTVTPVNGVPTATTIIPAGTTYTWAAPVVTGGVIGGAAGTAQTSVFGTLTNLTTSVQTATYTVTPTSGAAGACSGPSFTVTVTINPTPVISNYTTTAACSGTAFDVTPVDGIPAGTIVPPGTTYTWPRPAITGGLTGAAAGTAQTSIFGTLTNPTTSAQTATYTVTATSGAAGACPGPSTFTVIVTVPAPLVVNQTHTDSHCGAPDGTITVSPSGGTSPYTVSGPFSGSAPGTFTGLLPGVYSYTTTDALGCNLPNEVEILDACEPVIFYPNVFTPGGRDPYFQLFGNHIGAFNITIFNRWGEIIFYSDDFNRSWDGTYNGQVMEQGVYAYVVYYEGIGIFAKPHKKQGSVLLLK